MSVSPSIRLIAYPDRQNQFVFVAVPDGRGRYLRTDRSVVLAACPLCRSIKGEPCRNRTDYISGTHARRRNAANLIKGQQDDLIEPVDLLAPEPDAPPTFPDIEMPPIDIVIRPKILGSVTLCEPRPIV